MNFLINTRLASNWEGAVTAISVSFALMLIPEAAIAQAAAIAALPTFSAQVARGKPEEMRSSLALLLRTAPGLLGEDPTTPISLRVMQPAKATAPRIVVQIGSSQLVTDLSGEPLSEP